MSHTLSKVLVPPPVAEPRGAAWAAAAAQAVQGWRGRWRQRAARPADPGEAELLALARKVETESPALAAELRVYAFQRAAVGGH